jgi:hypothetical protein
MNRLSPGSLKGSVALHLVLITLLGLLVYSNTFDAPFQWDGIDHIVKNSALRDLDNFTRAKTLKSPRCVGYLTFALNYKLHGLDVTGYHVLNIFIHVLNAMLCYALVVLTFRTPFLSGSSLNTRSRYIALFTGLLFVSHPIQTQAVTYIVQRFASLAAFFCLASLAAYLKSRLSYKKTERVFFYALSLLSAAMAMKTKQVAFTLPLAIALYEFMFFSGDLRKRFLYLVPLLLTMLIIPLGVLGVEKPFDEMIGGVEEATRVRDVSRADYFLTQSRVVVTYLRLLVLPIDQRIYYNHEIYHSFFRPDVFLSVLFLLSILGIGIYLLYRSRVTHRALRLAAFGIFWFFITLSVESSIIPLHVIYEHRVYLPSAGAFSAFATGAFLLVGKLKSRKAQTLAVLSLIMVPLVFSCATYARNGVWRSEISLWEDAVKKSPHKEEGHNNLGTAYFAEGLIGKAIRHYQIAVTIRQDFAKAHNNLGIAYGVKGLIDKAIEHFQTALRLKPDYTEAHYNLGLAYLRKGHTDRARREFETALQINPDHHETRRLLERTVSPEKARAHQ